MNAAIVFPPKMGVTSRDVTCFVFAATLHSLLFLWKGGMLTLPEQQPGLGDMLVAVNFMAEVPNMDLPGGGAPKPQGFLARVTSILKGQGAPKIKSPGADETSQDNWSKADKLTDKEFNSRDGFSGLTDKKDALDIAKGSSQEVVMKPSDGNFQKAQPNLKENTFKMAKSDVPFPILKPKTPDALANVNAVPVVVGKTTSGSIKSLDGGPGAGPALQSKTFASKGSTSGGFSGMGKNAGGSGSGGMGIAMGGSGSSSAGGGSDMTGGVSGAGGSGYGSGGSGGGKGGGMGSNTGSGTGGGRSWGGEGGNGFGQMQTLPRNTVTDGGMSAAGTGASHQPGFTITGALASRPIQQKVLPPYETDARVALRFRVDWSGRVLDGIIVEISSGSPSFDQKVMTSLKQWIFSKLSGDKTNEVQEGLVSFVFKGV